MKATTLLERQHRKVEAILKKLQSGRAGASELLQELANDLAAHMAIEQEIFYPAVRRLDEDLIAESFEEHAIAELALKRLLSVSPTAPTFAARVTALKDLIEHHVEEEEEELFPRVEKKMDQVELKELGSRMKVAFEQALERGFESLVPKTMATTSADVANKAPARQNGHPSRGGAHIHR
jgi:iron-sulfur cluster repair protein YtfE (RIC family)